MRNRLIGQIEAVLVDALREMADTMPELEVRDSSIVKAVHDYMTVLGGELSESELLDILSEPTRLFKLFALFMETSNEANDRATTVH